MRKSCVSYLSNCADKEHNISANQASSLQLRLQGQKTLHNLERVEEEHAKQPLLEVRQKGLVGDI